MQAVINSERFLAVFIDDFRLDFHKIHLLGSCSKIIFFYFRILLLLGLGEMQIISYSFVGRVMVLIKNYFKISKEIKASKLFFSQNFGEHVYSTQQNELLKKIRLSNCTFDLFSEQQSIPQQIKVQQMKVRVSYP